MSTENPSHPSERGLQQTSRERAGGRVWSQSQATDLLDAALAELNVPLRADIRHRWLAGCGCLG